MKVILGVLLLAAVIGDSAFGQLTMANLNFRTQQHLKLFMNKIYQHNHHTSRQQHLLLSELKPLRKKVEHSNAVSEMLAKKLVDIKNSMKVLRSSLRTRSNELASNLDDVKMEVHAIGESVKRDIKAALRNEMQILKQQIRKELESESRKTPKVVHTRSVDNAQPEPFMFAQRDAPIVKKRHSPGQKWSKPKNIVASEADLGRPVGNLQTDYTDCSDVKYAGHQLSGVYVIQPTNSTKAFSVFCDLEGGDAWTLIQKRFNGKVNFYRDWSSYKHGFGALNSEFYLGNQRIHELTRQNQYKLRITMHDWAANSSTKGRLYVAYSNRFEVDSEKNNYSLKVPKSYYEYSGYSASGLRVHRGPFCTKDRNNLQSSENCAQKFHCGWWFTACVTNSNLNGRYYENGYADPKNRIRKEDDLHWPNINQSLRDVTMAIARKKKQ